MLKYTVKISHDCSYMFGIGSLMMVQMERNM